MRTASWLTRTISACTLIVVAHVTASAIDIRPYPPPVALGKAQAGQMTQWRTTVNACVGSYVSFNALGASTNCKYQWSHDIDNQYDPIPICDIIDCIWSSSPVGGTIGTTPIFSYAFNTSNTYTVTLTVRDLLLGRHNDFPTVDTATLTIRAVETEVRKVHFTSDHGVMNNWMTNYGSDQGTVFDPRGWDLNPAKNNPISHTKGQQVSASVTLYSNPAGAPFDLTGDGPIGALDFQVSGTTSGGEQTLSDQSAAALPNYVGVLTGGIDWMTTLKTQGEISGECEAGSSGTHTIYVTWGTPSGSTPTLGRIIWVCETAQGATTKEQCADDIWDRVAADTHFGSGGTDGWQLLDLGTGDCDNLARCMAYAVNMLGAGPAVVQFVRASLDGGAGHCLDFTERYCQACGKTEYLMLVFSNGLNRYEGCCETSDHYYSIAPQHKEHNDYDILRALGAPKEDGGDEVTQQWAWWNPEIEWYTACTQAGSSPPIP